jgi:putative endonuclease
MYYVYLINSTKNNEIYIGYTNNLKRRLVEHNTNKSFSTKNSGHWTLTYYESYKSKEDAIRREHNLKYHGQALNLLKKRLSGSLQLANLVLG